MSSFEKHSDFWIVGAEFGIGIGVSIVSFYLLPEQAAVITVLYSSILVFKNSLYFSLKYIDLHKGNSILEKIDRKIQLEDVMKLYNTIRPELKSFAKTEMNNFNKRIKLFSEGQRTGKLDQPTYYDSLIKYVKKTKKGDSIWACSTFLDEEWDGSINPREEHLMREFEAADQRGVTSTRLYIFNDEDDKSLQPNSSDVNSNIFIKNLLPYLNKDKYPNTSSFAIGRRDYDTLTEQQKKIIGEGFCAFDYADPRITNIFTADTVVDSPNTSKKRIICGEVLVNEDEINDTKELFNKTQSLRRTLKEYVFLIANNNAKVYLQNEGFSKP